MPAATSGAAEIYRISADGSRIETVASTGGFILGLAFDSEQNLYACDMRHSAVFRLDTRTEISSTSRTAEEGKR
jgi:gluconolactonase